MPIQASCFEKSKFQSTQATNFGRLLGVAVHQIFKSHSLSESTATWRCTTGGGIKRALRSAALAACFCQTTRFTDTGCRPHCYLCVSC